MIYDLEFTEQSFIDPATGQAVPPLQWRLQMPFIAIDKRSKTVICEFVRISKATYDATTIQVALTGERLRTLLTQPATNDPLGKQFIKRLWQAVQTDEDAMRAICLSRTLPDGVPFVAPQFSLVENAV